jgi:hypothetical protein
MIVLAHYNRRFGTPVLATAITLTLFAIAYCLYAAISGGLKGQSAWAIPALAIACVALFPYLIRNYRHCRANDPMIYVSDNTLIAFDPSYYLTHIAAIRSIRLDDQRRALSIDTASGGKDIRLFLAAESNDEIAANFHRLELSHLIKR